jgi:hypothetical protein
MVRSKAMDQQDGLAAIFARWRKIDVGNTNAV